MIGLLRPAPHTSSHRTRPAMARPVNGSAATPGTEPRDGFGLACESGDVLAGPFAPDTASPNTSRPRSAEASVDRASGRFARRRETLDAPLMLEREALT